MSDDEYEDDFEGEFIWFDEVEADLAVSAPLVPRFLLCDIAFVGELL